MAIKDNASVSDMMVQANKALMKPELDYVSGSNGQITINGILVDECYDVQYAYRELKEPIYGYKSKYFNKVLPGTVIIHGQLTINYVHDGYLTTLIEGDKAMLGKFSPDPNAFAKYRMTGDVTAIGNNTYRAKGSGPGLSKKGDPYAVALQDHKDTKEATRQAQVKLNNYNLLKEQKDSLLQSEWKKTALDINAIKDKKNETLDQINQNWRDIYASGGVEGMEAVKKKENELWASIPSYQAMTNAMKLGTGGWDNLTAIQFDPILGTTVGNKALSYTQNGSTINDLYQRYIDAQPGTPKSLAARDFAKLETEIQRGTESDMKNWQGFWSNFTTSTQDAKISTDLDSQVGELENRIQSMKQEYEEKYKRIVGKPLKDPDKFVPKDDVLEAKNPAAVNANSGKNYIENENGELVVDPSIKTYGVNKADPEAKISVDDSGARTDLVKAFQDAQRDEAIARDELLKTSRTDWTSVMDLMNMKLLEEQNAYLNDRAEDVGNNFDIIIYYNGRPHKKLVQCYLTGHSHAVMQGGEPIKETYTFFARHILTDHK